MPATARPAWPSLCPPAHRERRIEQVRSIAGNHHAILDEVGLVDPKPRRFTAQRAEPTVMAARVGFDLLGAPQAELPHDVPRGSLLFAPGRPDVRLAPGAALGRAYRRALSRSGGALLSYAAPEGHVRLREAVAAMLRATRGLAAAASNVCITRGSQMAISLVARSLLRPGDIVAVEQLGYRPAWESFRLAGARVVGIPVDAGGLRINVCKATRSSSTPWRNCSRKEKSSDISGAFVVNTRRGATCWSKRCASTLLSGSRSRFQREGSRCGSERLALTSTSGHVPRARRGPSWSPPPRWAHRSVSC